jgi:hypothetical protein
MKRNQNFDHNHSQKLLSFRYNIDTNRVEARFTDGSAVANRIQNFEQCESYTKPDVLWIALKHHLINSFNCSKRLHCTIPFSYKSDCLWNNFAYRP